MNAIDRIAELHAETPGGYCGTCGGMWPCLTRRLCDEAAEGPSPWKAAINMALDRDRWKADALTLALLLGEAGEVLHQHALWQPWVESVRAALAAHDALTAETEGT